MVASVRGGETTGRRRRVYYEREERRSLAVAYIQRFRETTLLPAPPHHARPSSALFPARDAPIAILPSAGNHSICGGG